MGRVPIIYICKQKILIVWRKMSMKKNNKVMTSGSKFSNVWKKSSSKRWLQVVAFFTIVMLMFFGITRCESHYSSQQNPQQPSSSQSEYGENKPDASENITNEPGGSTVNKTDNENEVKPSEEISNQPSENHDNKPSGDNRSKDNGNKPSKDTGNKPSKDTGDKPSEDIGDKPSADTGNKPGEDAGNKPTEDVDNKPGGNTGDKPNGDNGNKPSGGNDDNDDDDDDNNGGNNSGGNDDPVNPPAPVEEDPKEYDGEVNDNLDPDSTGIGTPDTAITGVPSTSEEIGGNDDDEEPPQESENDQSVGNVSEPDEDVPSDSENVGSGAAMESSN